MKSLPFALIYSRIIIGVLIAVIAYLQVNHYPIWIVSLMTLGLLTDVFDGIIARKLNVATEKLRLWDSNVDMFFWIIVIASIFSLNHQFFIEYLRPILLVVALEVICYIICYIKFKKSIATHSLLAKTWSITLLVFLMDLCLNGTSQTAFFICIILGLISRIEIALIILKLNKWATDVPSILSVGKMNRGIAIKKMSLFN